MKMSVHKTQEEGRWCFYAFDLIKSDVSVGMVELFDQNPLYVSMHTILI